jgi:hypothetical protein
MRHGKNGMNSAYVHKILVAAGKKPHAYLNVRGRDADRQVRLMAAAGLVEATLSDGKEQSFPTIKCVTNLGRAFLRTFKDSPIPTLPPPARTKGMAGEWTLNR